MRRSRPRTAKARSPPSRRASRSGASWPRPTRTICRCRRRSPPRWNGSATSRSRPATRPRRWPPMSRAWTSAARSADGMLGYGDNAGALAAYEQSLVLAGGSPRPTPARPIIWPTSRPFSKVSPRSSSLPATPPGALAGYQESLALRRRLAEGEKTGTKWRQNISLTLEKIGDLKQGIKDDAGAAAAYDEMLANDRALAAANPDNADRQRDVSLEPREDRQDEARWRPTAPTRSASTRRVSTSAAKLFEADSGNEQYKQGLSFVIEKVGDMRRDLGNADGALAAYQEMLVLDREIAAANIGDTKRQRDRVGRSQQDRRREALDQRHRRRAGRGRGKPQHLPPHRADRARQHRVEAGHLGQSGAARQHQVEHRRQARRAYRL